MATFSEWEDDTPFPPVDWRHLLTRLLLVLTVAGHVVVAGVLASGLGRLVLRRRRAAGRE